MDKTENSYIPIHLPLNKKYDIHHSSQSITSKDIAVSPGAKLWRSALEKLRSPAVVSDPWQEFNIELVQTSSAIRHRFSAIKKKWIKDEIVVKLEEVPFDRGAMRECFRMKKVSPGGDWSTASNYVAKRYISDVKSSVYMDDVRLQMEAKLWAEEFNRQDPPKKVDVFQMSVMEIVHNDSTSLSTPPDSRRRRGSFSTRNPSTTESSKQPISSFYHIERFMDGEYRKYNSNSGFVDSKPRNTPQAFSHFTFERSGHRLLVVDIQGVGDLYTDPQIHTSDGLGYNEGNLGIRGMSLFFHSHRCNPLCLWLGLSPFDLSSHEMSELIEQFSSVKFDSDDDDDDDDAHSEDSADEVNISISPSEENQNTKFPAIPFHVLPRKRSLSFGVFPLNNSFNASSLKSHKRLFGPTMARDHEFLLTPRLRTLSGSANCFANSTTNADYVTNSLKPDLAIHSACGEGSGSRLHQRQVSGDSGIAFFSNSIMRPPIRRISSATSDDHTDSLGELFDESPLPPFADVFQEVYSSYSCQLDNGANSSILSADSHHTHVQRGHRTSSESSDIDELEAVRLASHSLHHILHETQKPTSAAHPSNLDQEIGQSILGQMHHELARLHEAGRFLKRPGGWSKTGIGRLFPERPYDADIEIDGIATLSTPVEMTINWESVIFHEHHAAQLGCLEALIIMAHYYLGLPTQLLSECPIKARDEDLGLGVDYLWRSSEGGDRRCMILLARYLDASVFFSGSNITDPLDRSSLTSALNLTTTPIEDFFMLLGHKSFPIPSAASASGSPGPWAEAVTWYKRAVEHARQIVPGSPAITDEGCDAEGLYDAAEDLWPVHRLLARMAEMYSIGGFGLHKDCQVAGDLFNEAAELVMQQMNGRLASRYFELAEEAYSNVE